MDAHIIFGVNSVLNDNTCAPSIDALRTTHGDNIQKANPHPPNMSNCQVQVLKEIKDAKYLGVTVSDDFGVNKLSILMQLPRKQTPSCHF